ncbi:MAG: SDR family oxidoreductase [Actinomycetota bacterium]|nr:SDR family oxidoreductase [Actinomycetota bacterium]
MRVLVAGATGYLGHHVVRELADRGHTVRALARDPSRLGDLADLVDETVTADATDPAGLVGCCADVDALFSSIGIVGTPPRGVTYDDIDHGANLNLLREAESAGVGRFVYTSVFAPGMDDLKVVRAKRAFERDLERSPIACRILRPNGFFSDIDAFLSMARRGRAFVFGPGATGSGELRMNPIHGADVAVAAADAAEGSDDGEPVLSLGGPDVLTHVEIAGLAFSAIDRSAKVTHLPAWTARALVAALPRLTPQRVHGPAEFLLSVLSNDMVAPQTGTHRLADHFAEAAETA